MKSLPDTLPVPYAALTSAQKARVRQRYVGMQAGLCWHCKAPLLAPPPPHVLGKQVTEARFPQGFFTHPVHLHHSHVTGLTLGAVHAYCNAVLWEHFGQ